MAAIFCAKEVIPEFEEVIVPDCEVLEIDDVVVLSMEIGFELCQLLAFLR